MPQYTIGLQFAEQVTSERNIHQLGESSNKVYNNINFDKVWL